MGTVTSLRAEKIWTDCWYPWIGPGNDLGDSYVLGVSDGIVKWRSIGDRVINESTEEEFRRHHALDRPRRAEDDDARTVLLALASLPSDFELRMTVNTLLRIIKEARR